MKHITDNTFLKTGDGVLDDISFKVLNDKRISVEEGLILFENGEPGYLGTLANLIRIKKNGLNTYFKRNVHLEPTNICVYNCKFCSYSRKEGEDGSWEFTIDDYEHILDKLKKKRISEVHITGGVSPSKKIEDYYQLIRLVRTALPSVHIKAFSAVELYYIFKQSNVKYEEGLANLKNCGLNSIPGGGAEIFDEKIRSLICPDKVNSVEWLRIHECAHKAGIPSNATMLYGHIENYSHRIDHLQRLRDLQDKTAGFDTFIPLKFRNVNNDLSSITEVSIIEDIKNYAVSRIFLDNFPHIKAYWPMIGKNTTQLLLDFGVDDVDGTIDDSTEIYKMAGVKEKSNKMTINEFKKLVISAGYIPVLKDKISS